MSGEGEWSYDMRLPSDVGILPKQEEQSLDVPQYKRVLVKKLSLGYEAVEAKIARAKVKQTPVMAKKGVLRVDACMLFLGPLLYMYATSYHHENCIGYICALNPSIPHSHSNSTIQVSVTHRIKV